MEYNIDLSKKPSGYRKALLEYLNKPFVRDNGIIFELGHPKMGKLNREVATRLCTIDDDRVCARSHDIAVVGEEFTIWVGTYGPLKPTTDLKKLVPSARMNKIGDIVVEIYGFDLISKEDHVDS